MKSINYVSSREKIKSTSILNFFISFLILVMSITRNGNLNILYFFAPIFFTISLKHNKNNIIYLIVMTLPFFIILFLTCNFSKYFNNYEKSIIYILKMIICFSLFLSSKTLLFKLNIKEIVSNLIILILGLTTIAILTNSEYLWRFNDTTNLYSKTRLQLFFMEPSELSEVCGILLIIQFFYFRQTKNIKDLIYIVFCLIPLLLSAGLSGIVYSFLAILILVVFYEFKNFKNNMISYFFIFLLLISLISIILIMFNGNSPIVNRIFLVLNGGDGSFNYRFVRAIGALKFLLSDTNYIGVGLGNIRTDLLSDVLSNYNLISFSNSFIFFISEGGFVAIIFLISLLVYLLKNIFKNKETYENKCLKFSILFFLVVFQITGGYFTDPFIWIMYGVICCFK